MVFKLFTCVGRDWCPAHLWLKDIMGAPYGKEGSSLEKTTLSQLMAMEGLPSRACSIGPKAQVQGNHRSLEISMQGLKSSNGVTEVEMESNATIFNNQSI